MAFVRSQPMDFLQLAVKKFGYFWWFVPDFVGRATGGHYPGYYALVYLGEGLVVGGTHPALTGWLPSVVLLVVGLILCHKVSRI